MTKKHVHIAIGTRNQLKLLVIEKVFGSILKTQEITVEGMDCESDVPATPQGEETKTGATNRALFCQDHSVADYYIGIESGLVSRYDDIYEEAWACIIDNSGSLYFGYSSGLKLPPIIQKTMQEYSIPHSEAMRKLQAKHGLVAGDTWGNYTENTLSRSSSILEATRNALIQIEAPSKSLFKQN